MSIRERATPPSARRVTLTMTAFLVVLAAMAWGGFVLWVLPGRYAVGGGAVFGWTLALTAFLLGVRHAFDIDHIAAIDNTVRRLVANGDNPLSVGLWFALGHSTVVIVAVALLASGVEFVMRGLSESGSTLAVASSMWGSAISGSFLLVVGLVNLVSFRGIWRLSRPSQGVQPSEESWEKYLHSRGFFNRLLRRVAATVDSPRKMYPIGVLFGLGLDTASSIGLFVIGSGATLLAPWYVVMVLPLLFTAGMCLFDTLDGVVMNRTYRWAYNSPSRKVVYNLTITAMSVAVALLVGAIEILSLVTHVFPGAPGWFVVIADTGLDNLGYIIVALLLATWAVAALVTHKRRPAPFPPLEPKNASAIR
jgi:high-affinity nickel-transport protein